MKDIYTKSVLTVIAVCLRLLVANNARESFIEDVQAASCDEHYIISRFLYCIDGSSISGGRLSTYCNR
jgi:hypothetical protein